VPLPLPEIPSRIVAAPMAGGPSTPALVAAVGDAGGLGFLAAGYKTPAQVADEIAEVRRLSARPFGVNIFSPVPPTADPEGLSAYAALMRTHARACGTEVGDAMHSDDEFDAKCEVALHQRPDVVSFTFGLPSAAVLQRFRAERIPVAVTVCSEAEAREAQAAGADALVVQGWEAGGHRGGLREDDPASLGLLPLLRLARGAVDLPLIAAGGLGDGAAVAAVLAAGAHAAMLGTAFLRTPEAGTSPLHRDALTWDRPTVVTRAFTGRSARALANDFTERFTPHAVSAYPDVHFLTSPLRARARAHGDAENLHLWAGQAHRLARDAPAAQVVRDLTAEAATAAEAVVGLASRRD